MLNCVVREELVARGRGSGCRMVRARQWEPQWGARADGQHTECGLAGGVHDGPTMLRMYTSRPNADQSLRVPDFVTHRSNVTDGPRCLSGSALRRSSLHGSPFGGGVHSSSSCQRRASHCLSEQCRRPLSSVMRVLPPLSDAISSLTSRMKSNTFSEPQNLGSIF